ncbi:hypothetical protein [Pseudomonas sp. p99-361]|uniref:hypothetical protein n=1 Tax=Pseudomonas sp. p99-361 TaxID=2479852 RepID=UPI000F7998AE|nr:hypothetical protein [Pseudomonas sp. p99-361]RRV60343.1 hypothetical protein EGJ15_20180 [Pseudomonas sp. p99-361]
MKIATEIYRTACRRFEAQIEECVERVLGCSLLEGLERERVSTHAGQVFVDGLQVCYVEPPRLSGMNVVWVFQDLTGEQH